MVLLKRLTWPSVKDMIRSEAAAIASKSVNNLVPDYLSHSIINIFALDTVSLRNAETDLQGHFMKTGIGQKAFGFRETNIWDELFCEAKQGPSEL